MQSDDASRQCLPEQLERMVSRAVTGVEPVDPCDLYSACRFENGVVISVYEVKPAHVSSDVSSGERGLGLRHDHGQPGVRAAVEDGQRCVWSIAQLDGQGHFVREVVGTPRVSLA